MNNESKKLNVNAAGVGASDVNHLGEVLAQLPMPPESAVDTPLVVIRFPDLNGSGCSGTGGCGTDEQTAGERISNTSCCASSDRSATPDTWQKDVGDSSRDRGGDTKSPQQDDHPAMDEEAIGKITTEILDRFPAGGRAIILFSGSEDNPHCEETCAQVAAKLASMEDSRVLLVDSDFECAKLSSSARSSEDKGLSDWLAGDFDFQDVVSLRSEIGLDFVSVGRKEIEFWQSARVKLSSRVRNLKEDYRFVCVSVGDAHRKSVELWSDIADGTFLVVSMEYSSRTVARSAGDHLKSIGARVLGCIVTES